MTQFLIDPTARATFAAAKATKVDLARGSHLFAGLNCFEPGQTQPVHSHRGADKFYLILSGKARMIVGGDAFVAEKFGTGVRARHPCPARGKERSG